MRPASPDDALPGSRSKTAPLWVFGATNSHKPTSRAKDKRPIRASVPPNYTCARANDSMWVPSRFSVCFWSRPLNARTRLSRYMLSRDMLWYHVLSVLRLFLRGASAHARSREANRGVDPGVIGPTVWGGCRYNSPFSFVSDTTLLSESSLRASLPFFARDWATDRLSLEARC